MDSPTKTREGLEDMVGYWYGIDRRTKFEIFIRMLCVRGPLFSPGKLRGACYSLLRRRRQAEGLLLKRVFPGI